jgi:Rod binding domain-containing protein
MGLSDPVGSIRSLTGTGANFDALAAAARGNASDRAKEEFLTIFYKELLKQSFKAPSLNLSGGGEDQDSFFSDLNSDLMVEQLARHLAKNSSSQLNWVTMPDTGSLTQGIENK